jgi:hemin uptake protein HemP
MPADPMCPPSANRTVQPPRSEPPLVQSHDILRGSNLIRIAHAGDHYYLRMTRNNKLILTK